MTLHM